MNTPVEITIVGTSKSQKSISLSSKNINRIVTCATLFPGSPIPAQNNISYGIMKGLTVACYTTRHPIGSQYHKQYHKWIKSGENLVNYTHTQHIMQLNRGRTEHWVVWGHSSDCGHRWPAVIPSRSVRRGHARPRGRRQCRGWHVKDVP